MKTLKFRLTLDVTFDPQGTHPDDLRRRMQQVVIDATNNGTLTGETPATVEEYDFTVKRVLPPKKGRRCGLHACDNVATHKVLSYGQEPFLVCRKHIKEFRRQYRTKHLKKR